MSKTPIKPGTDNQPAGTYVEKGPRGGNVPGGRVVHIDKGDYHQLKNQVMVGLNNNLITLRI